MSENEDSQPQPQPEQQAAAPAQPQVEKPPTMPAGPNSSMPSQGAGWARASPSQVVRTVAAALLTTAVVLGALFLLWQVRDKRLRNRQPRHQRDLRRDHLRGVVDTRDALRRPAGPASCGARPHTVGRRDAGWGVASYRRVVRAWR